MVFPPRVTTLPIVPNENGAIYVAGTRIPIDLIIQAFQEGATPDEIVSRFDVLALSDVYAVITYYLNKKSEVDSDLARRKVKAAAKRDEMIARNDLHGMRERLLARVGYIPLP